MQHARRKKLETGGEGCQTVRRGLVYDRNEPTVSDQPRVTSLPAGQEKSDPDTGRHLETAGTPITSKQRNSLTADALKISKVNFFARLSTRDPEELSCMY